MHCLSNPSVVPDWCPEIARALFSCQKPENAMLFIHVSGVELEEELDMLNRMSELLRKDLTLAFLFQVILIILMDSVQLKIGQNNLVYLLEFLIFVLDPNPINLEYIHFWSLHFHQMKKRLYIPIV